MEEEEMDELMATLFAIFYVDDTYIASRDPVFLLRAIDGLVSAFERVGLETNTKRWGLSWHRPPRANLEGHRKGDQQTA